MNTFENPAGWVGLCSFIFLISKCFTSIWIGKSGHYPELRQYNLHRVLSSGVLNLAQTSAANL